MSMIETLSSVTPFVEVQSLCLVVRTSIPTNRPDTYVYLGAQVKCVIARLCQATDRAGVIENALWYI